MAEKPAMLDDAERERLVRRLILETGVAETQALDLILAGNKLVAAGPRGGGDCQAAVGSIKYIIAGVKEEPAADRKSVAGSSFVSVGRTANT